MMTRLSIFGLLTNLYKILEMGSRGSRMNKRSASSGVAGTGGTGMGKRCIFITPSKTVLSKHSEYVLCILGLQ